ncbi:MAG: methyltransferase domain-containing protein [Eubacterium sp.]|nr:methyltransferase domain-containing protein [Eubacterium sp.]
MTDLVAYYNKFNEEKRLQSRHGQVEYHTTMHYIHRYLELLQREREADGKPKQLEFGNAGNRHTEPLRIIDIGAGTGRYSVALAAEGYDVTAVELVKYNLGILKQKGANVKAYQGNALKLKRFADNSFDLTLLFGPMYHLHSDEDQIQALSEAKRVTRPGGIIMVAYVMNDYSVIKYGFMEDHIAERVQNGELTDDFQIRHNENELYDYVRLEQINALNQAVGVKRELIIAPDGPADYIRPVLNAMDEEAFELFLQYQLKNCERPELLGASSHTVDILRKC